MKKGNRCLVLVLVAALLLAMADTGMSVKKADAATETTAYLEFKGQWDDSSSYPGGSDSKVNADNAVVDGNGVYRVSLDFTQCGDIWNGMSAHGITNCVIRIQDGEQKYDSMSYIQVRSVKITSLDGKEEPLENIDPNYGYTYADKEGNTSFCLFSANIPWSWTWEGESEDNIRSISGDKVTKESAQDSANYQLLSKWSNKQIQSIEVIFAFAENKAGLDKIPANATPKPHTSATPEPSATSEATETPASEKTPTPSPKETATSNPEETPTATPEATVTPDPDGPTPTPQSSAEPNETPAPSGNIVSNSTYTGQEKIFVNKSAIVVAAGGHGSVTIALLRGASSTTQVTASSGNSSIAVPTLQANGKLDIAVPTTASAGSSTTVTLRFGNSSATVKVTVSNPVTKIKGAKKAYKIKRKKTAKVSVNLTPKNTANAITDTVTATISKKKVASITSVKLSKNKAVIKVKALKKGSAQLKVKAGGKSASIKIKVK